MENGISKKQYPLVDVMKFIMAVVVIGIHRSPFENEFLYFIFEGAFGRVAVPFFFVTSTNLLFSKLRNNPTAEKQNLIRYEKRILKIYIIWFIIYSLGLLAKNYIYDINSISLKSVIDNAVVSLKEFFLNGGFIHLWYLSALIAAVPLVWILVKKFGYRITLLLSVIAYVCDSVFQILTYHSDRFLVIYDRIPDLITNVSGIGFFCVALGALPREKLKLSKEKCKILLCVFFILLTILGVLKFKFESECIGLCSVFLPILEFLLAYLIMALCMESEFPYSSKTVFLRKASILMYLSHKLFMKELYDIFADVSGVSLFAESGVIQFLLDLIFAFLFSWLVIYLSKIKGFRWLKNFY